jgi:hypothetical protein
MKEQEQQLRQIKAEALDHSRLLDVHVWSEHPEANLFVNSIYDQFFKTNSAIKKKHLKVVLLDLYVSWKEHPEQFLSVHMSPKDYSGLIDRYNSLHIKGSTIYVVKILHAVGLIELHRGFQHSSNPLKSRVTRIKATPALIKLFEAANVRREDVSRHKNWEVIQLKDSKKKLIDYEDTPSTRRMRNFVKAYNQLLSKTDVSCSSLAEGFIVLKDEKTQDKKTQHIGPQYQQVHRVFNNGSFEEGGRFYGGWWQSLPKEHRQNILINGKPTVEVDFSGTHIVMLYGLRGVWYREDPYALDEDLGLPENVQREVCKTALLVVINAKSEKQAIRALTNDLTLPEGIERPSRLVRKVLEALKKKHAPIDASLCSGVGTKLQFLDSQITERIIEWFMERDVPILTVHDSYIVPEGWEQDLRDLMREEWAKQLGFWKDPSSATFEELGFGFPHLKQTGSES